MRCIALQLRRLFLDHDCVVVPGLGGFVFHVVPARYDADARVLVPPGREVVFNPRLIHNDGVLAHSLTVDTGLPYAEALAIVEREAAEMRTALAVGSPVVLDGVGRLYREAAGIRFVADAELERHLRSFGLQRIPLMPLAVVPLQLVAEAAPTSGEPAIPVVPFRRQLLRAAAVFAIPATVGAALWLGSGAPGERFGWSASPVETTSTYFPRFAVEALAFPAPAVEAVYDAAWEGNPEEIRFHFRAERSSDRGVRIVGEAAPVTEASAAPVAVPEPIPVEVPVVAVATDAPFEVVVGAFSVARNADRLADRLTREGRAARTDLRGDGMTLVVWGGYGDAGTAESARLEAAAAGFSGAWVRRMQ